jgi:hypothetical protein
MMTRLCLLAALLLLAGCGGGGGSSASSTTSGSSGGGTTTTTTPTNTVALTVDAGPTGLDTGPNGYIQDNVPYVTITLCPPGSTSNCQTIDHVEIDTGSSGLRVLASVLDASLLSAMPLETDTQGNPVGECLGFVDGYVFGSVRTADLTVGGEKAASIPLQIIGDTGQFATVPESCSAGGGTNQGGSLQSFGANGLMGVGPMATDCDSLCATAGGYGAAIYYDCPSSGCGAITARSPLTTAPFQQLPNPVVAFAVDNNGVIVSLPAVPAAGETSVTGTLYFGIGTQTNNALGSATVLTTTTSASEYGVGFITVQFNGQSLQESYIDSGTTIYLFDDSSLTECSGADEDFYCPTSSVGLSATLQGQNSASEAVDVTIENAATLLATSYSVLPDLGANPDVFSGEGFPDSFAFGLPFFYGRNVYTAIEGRSAGGVVGPYFAF